MYPGDRRLWDSKASRANMGKVRRAGSPEGLGVSGGCRQGSPMPKMEQEFGSLMWEVKMLEAYPLSAPLVAYL